ncbi:MAG: S24 family peptidase [Actinomycetales bacterium]|nr:S24 family peptidase [Candidatus Phosphoribacter baldrii]
MEPTLHEGDRLIVLWGGPVIPGRLALVRLPDSPGGPRPLSVKRVSGPEADRPGHWWIERDNEREGVDSWQVGGIPAADVAALVVARIPALPALRVSLRRLTPGRLG